MLTIFPRPFTVYFPLLCLRELEQVAEDWQSSRTRWGRKTARISLTLLSDVLYGPNESSCSDEGGWVNHMRVGKSFSTRRLLGRVEKLYGEGVVMGKGFHQLVAFMCIEEPLRVPLHSTRSATYFFPQELESARFGERLRISEITHLERRSSKWVVDKIAMRTSSSPCLR
jgi:hypothetical protein